MEFGLGIVFLPYCLHKSQEIRGPLRVPTGVTIKQEPELPIAVRVFYFKVKGMKLHKYNDQVRVFSMGGAGGRKIDSVWTLISDSW